MTLNFPGAFFCTIVVTVFCAEATEHSHDGVKHFFGWLGQRVHFPCNFSTTADAVYWEKLNDSDPSHFINKATYFVGESSSKDRRFTIGTNFSLVIIDLRVSDEGRYLCQFEATSGNSFKKYNDLTVQALARTPTIKQCYRDTKGSEVDSFCTARTSHQFPTFHLNCNVTGFRPNVSLKWTSSGIVKQPLGEPFQRELPDGTSEREVTISVTAKLDEERNYTCTVRGEATNGTDRSATVKVLALPAINTVAPTSDGLGIGGIVGIIFALIFLITVLLIVILILLYEKNKLPSSAISLLDHTPLIRLRVPIPVILPGPSSGPKKLPAVADEDERETENLLKQAEELLLKQERRETLRDEIKDYTPGKFVGITLNASKVNIGLFGQMAAGKSSLINSLYYALKGTHETITEEGVTTGGAQTEHRLSHPLTPHINVFDNRGMKDYSDANMNNILAQLRGERGLDPSEAINPDKDNEVHCAIFVYEYKPFGREQAFGFITKFVRDVGKYHQRGPMFVVTHKKDVPDLTGLMESLATCGVTKDKVGCWENYTILQHVEDVDKDIEMLEFLKKALQAGDWNIHHQERKAREETNNARCHVM